MAECLEETSNADTDRVIDECSFTANQFDLFTHDYRESLGFEVEEKKTCGSEETDSCCGSGTCGKDTVKDSRKAVTNVTRKLNRAKCVLESLPGSSAVSDMITKLDVLSKDLVTAVQRETAEFAPSTVALPEFDVVEMELLLGKDEKVQETPMADRLKIEREKSRQKIDALLVEAEILLREYDDIKHGLSQK